jgi:sodium/hydrogen antiporter
MAAVGGLLLLLGVLLKERTPVSEPLVALLAGVLIGPASLRLLDLGELAQEEIQEAISRFLDLPIFAVLGIALPWEGWLELGWGGLLLVAAVLLLRRLPAVLALRHMLGPLRSRGKDVLFLGWFGP